MKYLITGAGGQLGSEWVKYLETTGEEFKAFTSKELNITLHDTVMRVVVQYQPDVIVNCAAYTNVDGAESEPEKAFMVNKTGVENLVDACIASNCKLVHYSTDYIFSGNSSDAERYPDGYPEDAEFDPINVYGKSKFAGEEVIKKKNMDALIIRVSWLCSSKGKNFVNTMLRLGHEKNRISVVDDQIGSPSFTFDVVKKTHFLISKRVDGIFHITSRGKISWADFAEEIFHQSALKVGVVRISSDLFPVKAKRPAFSLLSTKKLSESGLEIHDWKDGLHQLLENRDKE